MLEKYPNVNVEIKGLQTRISYSENGESLSHLVIFDRWMYYDKARLHVGCIGDVYTSEKVRNKGMAREVLCASIDWMSDRYEMSMLFGIPDFYDRFGFVSCLPEYRATIRVADAERATSQMKHRPMVAEDQRAILALHRRRFECSIGAFCRDPEVYESRRMGSTYGRRANARVFLARDDSIAGYLVYDNLASELVIAEVAGYGEDFYDSALAFAVAAAKGRRLSTIEAVLPVHDPFMLHARKYGCELTVRFQRNRGGMMRICNLLATFDRLSDNLAMRWPSEFPGLNIETDVGVVSLRNAGRRLLIRGALLPGLPTIELPQSLLTTMLMGFRTVENLMAEPRCRCDPKALELAKVLFPLQEVFVPGPDRF